MRTNYLFIGCFVASCASTAPAKAQFCPEPNTKEQRFSRLKYDFALVKADLDRVEGVPPETIKFIEDELQYIRRNLSGSRLVILKRNPYYYANEVRKDYEVYKQNYQAALNAVTVADEAVYLSVVLSRSEDLSKSYTEYLEADARRKPRIVPQDIADYGDAAVSRLKGELVHSLQCAIRKLREPEPQ